MQTCFLIVYSWKEAGTYFCLWITKKLCGSCSWWLGNGDLLSQAEQQYPWAATLLQPLAPALATFTPANAWVARHPKCLFPPSQAEPQCRSRARAAHPQSGDQIAWQPPGCVSRIACFPACSLVSQKSLSPIPAPRHFPKGCRPVQELTCLVHCHCARLVQGLTQSQERGNKYEDAHGKGSIPEHRVLLPSCCPAHPHPGKPVTDACKYEHDKRYDDLADTGTCHSCASAATLGGL